jgi:alanine racemase
LLFTSSADNDNKYKGLPQREDFILGKRPTVALIDLKALRSNYAELKKAVPDSTAIMAIVKANAYGHGDVVIGRELERLGCDFLGVAFVEEAVRLREAGIKTPIVVLAGVYQDEIKEIFEHNLTPVVFDATTAALLNTSAKKYGKKLPVHVKIDSGMSRLGLLPGDVVSFFQEFGSFENLSFEGLMSHFSEAESPQKEYSRKQLEVFLKVQNIAEGLGFSPRYLHMANSAALVDMPEARFNLVRPGLMLYGVYPSARLKEKIRLKPVLQLKTRILSIKNVPPGSAISYNRTFIAKRQSLVATIPIGYGDGVPFGLSGNGEALVGGRRVPIRGRVCMDLTILDVTEVEGVREGDEVVIIGTQGEESITVEELAEKAGTIPYEVLTGISSRVERMAE